jgi:hypothetical protein
LLRKLHVTNDKLKKYGNVNKKALDQYVNFTSQRDTLIQRKEQLDKSEAGITDLIEVRYPLPQAVLLLTRRDADALGYRFWTIRRTKPLSVPSRVCRAISRRSSRYAS